MKIPGSEHPISIAPNSSRVRVMLGGKVLADTRRALTMRETSLPPVHYIPREDVDMALLTRTAHATHCPVVIPWPVQKPSQHSVLKTQVAPAALQFDLRQKTAILIQTENRCGGNEQ